MNWVRPRPPLRSVTTPMVWMETRRVRFRAVIALAMFAG